MTIKEFWESEEDIAIHCDTEDKANKLLRKFDELGKKWCTGSSYLLRNEWKRYEEKTCYKNDGLFGSVNFYKKEGYTIIEFDDIDDFKIFTKDDLKNRMVVECRNGEKYMIVDGYLIGKKGYSLLQGYADNLICVVGHKEFDIINVFEKNDHFGNGFNAYLDDDNREIIWERKEEILTKEEKEYLATVIKPVRGKVECISKKGYRREYISINIKDNDKDKDCFELYLFEKGTQFIGMETDKEYTLEELGL
ncbi:MAG: hypothetical protein [Podoviridae sp. ctcf755]|nr:MAG: hypothetical protein [Podoviridae sp. ctcf755]